MLQTQTLKREHDTVLQCLAATCAYAQCTTTQHVPLHSVPKVCTQFILTLQHSMQYIMYNACSMYSMFSMDAIARNT